MTGRLLEQARQALENAREDPRPALEKAREVVAVATTDEERATAHFAIGMAHRTLASGTESTHHLEEAAGHARSLPELHGQILRSLAFNYAQAGQHAVADRTIARSVALLTGIEADLSRLQQAFILIMRGEHRRALPALTNAIGGFEEAGQEDYLELTLFNRANIHTELGDYGSAVSDLERAYEIGMRLGHQVSAAEAALHLSQVLGWRDDIPAAMQWHARSVELRTAAGADNPVAETEHAFLLIQARLMREAEETLMAALPRLVAAGDNQAIAVQGHLLLAEVLTARGAYPQAAEQVALAAAASPEDGRYRFDIAAADHRTNIAAGETSTELLNAIIATAAEMDANGERHAAAMERFRAVDVALSLGDVATAAQMCDNAARVVRAGPLWLQIAAWTALASVRMALGNKRGAAAAVRAGLNRLDEYRAGIGATDLRIRAGEHGQRLGAMGQVLAIESGSPERVYNSAERLRTASGLARRDEAPELQDALGQLRRLSSRIRRADGADLAKLEQQLRHQQGRVRDLTRRSTAGSPTHRPAPLAAIQSELNQHALVEFTAAGDHIYGLVVTAETARLVDLGMRPNAVNLIDQFRMAAERIARAGTSLASRQAAFASAADLSGQIHDRLFEPLRRHIDRRRPIIVPTAELHGMPWGHILAEPFEIAPSATAWLSCRTRRHGTGTAVVVTGPALEHSAAESAAIAAASGATTLKTAEEALPVLPEARLAHFACHARARADSPMFSSLLLEDGEVTLHDIERLQSAPETVVLAACDGGSAVLASGDEVMGIAGAFLGLGSRAVVAPLFTVSDAATAEVMIRLHTRIAAGDDVATALAATRTSDDSVAAFTARSFSCFGAA